MNNSMIKSWVTECFAKRPDGFFHRQRALLVMDSMRAHITDDVKDLLHSDQTLSWQYFRNVDNFSSKSAGKF
jgi:hypothetical protein